MAIVFPTVAGLPTPWTYSYIQPMTLMGDNTGYTSTVTFNAPFANLATFCNYVGGTSQAVSTATTGYTFQRITPMIHPLYSALWATSIDCEAFGTPGGGGDGVLLPGYTAPTFLTDLAHLWGEAKIKVTFQTPPYFTAGDQPYMQFQADQGSVYTTAPGRKFKFPSGEPLDQDAGAFATLNQYVLTLYQCPQLNDAAIDSLGGCYNQYAWFGRPPGQMLFGGCKSNYDIAIGGVVRYQRDLIFTYRSYHWNQAYRRDGTLDTPVDPAGNPQYSAGDFSTLLN